MLDKKGGRGGGGGAVVDKVFISLGYDEKDSTPGAPANATAFKIAKVLQTALATAHVSAYICEDTHGRDMADEIATKMERCKLAVIFGTSTYGQKTSSTFSTYEELQFIKAYKPPEQKFTMKMCEEYKLSRTKMLLRSTEQYYTLGYFPNGDVDPGPIVKSIKKRLGYRKQSGLPLVLFRRESR